ncbi:MAG TPA: DUF5054 domain-containing protein [Bryobacteraceae bacterium]|nr:DUF5054 domain-containing protein [Bryobacteraceae bacterium]
MMRRRNFVRNLLAAGALGTLDPKRAPADQAAAPVPDPSVKWVLVMFKCHLDVGFIDTQANVVRKYFEVHFPRAIQTAAVLRKEGRDPYVWTTGSWLIYQYLDKAGAAERQRMEEAIHAGDIAWHALPFTWQTELMDRSLIAGGVGLSKSLDRRFHRTTTGAKMTDVPGHTRGIIAPLVAEGVKFLDIGVNSASTPPDVPPLFLWNDAAENSLIVMYHLREYGGIVKIPGSDLAIDIEVANDNAGPHTVEAIHRIYAGLRRQFPNAEVKAANLTEIANAVAPHSGRLPVVTQEVGDTWIYGVPSDPLKVARYWEVARLRNEWIGAGKLQAGGDADLAFLSRLLLEVEHTWGTDTKTWLDFNHYTPHDLKQMLDQPKYKVVQASWKEKREDLFDAIAALPAELRAQATERVQALQPAEPPAAGLAEHRAADPIETRHFTVALDPKTGAITRLEGKQTRHNWASATRPLALFSYQTLSKRDYDRFFEAYLKSKADWAPKDFGKPNIERFGAGSRTWIPALAECRHSRDANGDRILARLHIDDEQALKTGRTSWPQRMFLELLLPDAEPVVDVRFSWFGKASNRLPEALWLSFQPAVADPRGWSMEKSGSSVSPFDVVTGGNRAMHAVLGGLHYQGADGRLSIEPRDAPVVSLGERIPVYFTRNQPDLTQGFHFSLFNNGWGTNYVQWFGEDMSFRFRITA